MRRLRRYRWMRFLAPVLAVAVLAQVPALARRSSLDIGDIHGGASARGSMDVGDIHGRPGDRALRTGSRVVLIATSRRSDRYRGYRAGIEEGLRRAARKLAQTLPPPEIARRATETLGGRGHLSGLTRPGTQVRHLQTVCVQFVDARRQPVRGLEVIPIARWKQGPERQLGAARTDRAGRLVLRDLTEVPVSLEFQLPKSPDAALPDEWQYRAPTRAQLVLDHFQGRSSIRVAQVPPPGIQIACLSLETLHTSLFAQLVAATSAKEKLDAVRLALKAHDRIALAEELLQNQPIHRLPEALRRSVRKLLAEGDSFAGRAIQQDPGLLRAYQYSAEARWFGGDPGGAVRRLESAHRKFPASRPIALQLRNYRRLSEGGRAAGDRIDVVTGRPPSGALPAIPSPAWSGVKTVKVVTVRHVYNAPPIELQRNVVDMELQLPEDAGDVAIYVPNNVRQDRAEQSKSEGRAGGSRVEAQVTGSIARVRLPADIFALRPVPLCVRRTSSVGEYEAVVSNYPVPDPYAPDNRLTVPALHLVSLADVQPPHGVDVLSRLEDARHVLRGLPRGQHDRHSSWSVSGDDNSDGSWWTKDERAGIALRVRNLPFGKDGRAVPFIETIRLTRTGDGPVGGIRVGDNATRVEELLGPAEGSAADSLSYLQGGVRFDTAMGKVDAIELLRPTQLLREGTTAFVRRHPATVYVEAFEAPRDRLIRDQRLFEGYLERTGVVRLVRSREEAEYVLSARLENFSEDKDQLLGTVPLKYQCSADLVYSLYDQAEGRWIAQDQRLSSRKSANWMADFGKMALGGWLFSRLIGKYVGGDAASLVGGALTAEGVVALRQSMSRAVARTPRLVEQAVYNQLSDELYRTVDFAGRVTAIDYATGEVTVNLGTDDGVVAAAAGRDGTTFDLLVAGQPLPGREEGLSADFYTLQVVAVDATASRCVLRHVTRKLVGKGTREEIRSDECPEVVQQIPQPQAGVVSVRIRNRLLPITDL